MMGSIRTWWIIVIALLLVIIGLLVVLVAVPAPTTPASPVVPTATTSPVETTTTTTPLSARVSVLSPKKNAKVSHTFEVTGQAPGTWFFEAQFPMQVRDPEDNVIGRATGNAQGDWMTEKLVAFKATMHIDETYHGPATLILMKDNPSGLPENDDSVTKPIVVQ